MRDAVQTFYLFLLRAVGATVLAFVILSILGAMGSDLPGLRHPLPIAATGLSLVLALTFMLPRMTPPVIAQPHGLRSGLVTAALFALAPFIFMIPVMGAVVIFEVTEPLSRQLAVSGAGIVFAASALLWWLAIILSIWQPPHPPQTARRTPGGIDLSPLDMIRP